MNIIKSLKFSVQMDKKKNFHSRPSNTIKQTFP